MSDATATITQQRDLTVTVNAHVDEHTGASAFSLPSLENKAAVHISNRYGSSIALMGDRDQLELVLVLALEAVRAVVASDEAVGF